MNTLLWIAVAYLLSVILTMPLLKLSATRTLGDDDPLVSSDGIAKFVSFIPFINIYMAVLELRYRFKIWKVARSLRKVAKHIKDPETKAKLIEIANNLHNLKD